MIAILNAYRDCLMGNGFRRGTLSGLAVSTLVARGGVPGWMADFP